MNLSPAPETQEYRDASHYWQQRCKELEDELATARREITRLVELAYGVAGRTDISLPEFAAMMKRTRNLVQEDGPTGGTPLASHLHNR